MLGRGQAGLGRPRSVGNRNLGGNAGYKKVTGGRLPLVAIQLPAALAFLATHPHSMRFLLEVLLE